MKKLLTENQIETVKLHLQKKKKRIDIYVDLINSNTIDDSYKDKYKNYYTMKRSFKLNNENYYNVYFEYLKNLKSNSSSIDFGTILKYLSQKTTASFISPSYASKLLATINPNKPVWDTNVLIQLNNGLYEEYKKTQTDYYKTRDEIKYINKLITIYNNLEKNLNDEYLNTNKGKEFIGIFDSVFENIPEFIAISPMKKIDIILWSLGNKPKL